MINRYNYNSLIKNINNNTNDSLDNNSNDSLDNNTNHDINSENKIENIENKIENIENIINEINIKNDKILLLLNSEVVENTKKMSQHIDFIENIYTNIKSPLGYLCNKINYFKQNDAKVYSLDYKSK